MFSVAGLGAAIAEVVANSKTDADEERSFEEAYQEDGFAFTGNIFNSHEMDDIEVRRRRACCYITPHSPDCRCAAVPFTQTLPHANIYIYI